MPLNLSPCNDLSVDSAYIITVKDNIVSENLAARAADSCRAVGQKFEFWPAFDGTDGKTIKVPDQHKNATWLSWLKLMDTNLSTSEIACILSHFSLWCHCLEINRSIVILEHDAVMNMPYKGHLGLNLIVYLGCKEQALEGWQVTPCPPFGTLPKNVNYKYILRTHAYAIDPFMAKRLISYFIDHGIWEELAVAIRSDIFSIVQAGLFAYDKPEFDSTGKLLTTIVDTKEKRYGK